MAIYYSNVDNYIQKTCIYEQSHERITLSWNLIILTLIY